MEEKERNILHCDCNSFYASVELLPYPELKDKPVAVGGSQESRHGIVLAKNEAAKKFGIRTAETIVSAKQKCPDLIILPPHRERYIRFSKIINGIYNSYTDLVEPFGIDESWLDVTNSYHLFAKTPKELADKIRMDVYCQTGLTLSVGVSFNKIFAKLGSDYKKPNATTVISKENYKEIVFPLKVQDMIYVGKTTQAQLNALGIFTIGDLAKQTEEFLASRFGKHGRELYIYANGLENSPVAPYTAEKEYKSVGSGNTFYRNLQGLEDIKPALTVLSEEVGSRLRKYGLYANGVQLSVKNPAFETVSRQCKIPSTNLAQIIYQTALELYCRHINHKNPVRALTVTAIDLTKEKVPAQTTLFETNMERENQKAENLQAALDKIKAKYGRDAVIKGNILKTDIFKE